MPVPPSSRNLSSLAPSPFPAKNPTSPIRSPSPEELKDSPKPTFQIVPWQDFLKHSAGIIAALDVDRCAATTDEDIAGALRTNVLPDGQSWLSLINKAVAQRKGANINLLLLHIAACRLHLRHMAAISKHNVLLGPKEASRQAYLQTVGPQPRVIKVMQVHVARGKKLQEIADKFGQGILLHPQIW